MRGALPTDVTRIRELCLANDFPQLAQANFERASPHWFIAEDGAEDVVLGALQVALGLPSSIAEPLLIDRQVLGKKRDVADVIQKLALSAMAMSAGYGADFIQFTVPESLVSWAEVLENRGAIRCSTGTIFLKRVQSDGWQQHNNSSGSASN